MLTAHSQVTNVRGPMVKIATDFLYPSKLSVVQAVSVQLRTHRLEVAGTSKVTNSEVIPAIAVAYWTCLRLATFPPKPSDEGPHPMRSNIIAVPLNQPSSKGQYLLFSRRISRLMLNSAAPRQDLPSPSPASMSMLVDERMCGP